ncbi:MAG: hypothetical protein HEP71_31630 [Roseivirga sp.]|nr:hypothetical protein [Roseivirga sp.]
MSKDKKLEGYLKNWQEAEPDDLYKNFHKLDKEKQTASFFVRGTEFKLGQEGLEVLNGQKTPKSIEKSELTRINLWIGLSDFHKETIGFTPILGLTFENADQSESFFYEMGNVNPLLLRKPDDSSLLPLPFVEQVKKNWIETTSDQMTDTVTSQSAIGLERVLVYEITGGGLDFFIENRKALTNLYLYPGVDLNKSSVEDISFISVFGLRFNNLLKDTTKDSFFRRSGYGISWTLKKESGLDEDEVFLDYARPCPPTCPPPPPPPPGSGV